MRRIAAFAALTILCLSIFAVLPAGAWTVEDCIEVNYDHPDCDQYPTTTIPRCEYNPNHPFCTTTTTGQTTTTSEVTTTTGCDEEQCPTTTQPETTTTVERQETTTTTAAPCAPGLIHQPPLCVDPSTTTVPATSADTTIAPTTEPLEVLPFTGVDSGMLALSALGLLALGGAMIRKGRTA